jgi:cytochrome P450 family 6
MDEVAAQVFVFFIGGFETSSITMSFCLYELVLNPDVQQRLQDEIDTVLQEYGGMVTYEAIQKMEYLEKTVAGETHFSSFEAITHTYTHTHTHTHYAAYTSTIRFLS